MILSGCECCHRGSRRPATGTREAPHLSHAASGRASARTAADHAAIAFDPERSESQAGRYFATDAVAVNQPGRRWQMKVGSGRSLSPAITELIRFV